MGLPGLQCLCSQILLKLFLALLEQFLVLINQKVALDSLFYIKKLHNIVSFQAEIIVRGGLGNQLFIIFEAYKLLNRARHPVVLNLSEYHGCNRSDRLFMAGNLLPQVFKDFRLSFDIFARLRFFLAKMGAKFVNSKNSSSRLPGDRPFIYVTVGFRRVYIGYYQYINSSLTDQVTLLRMRSIYSKNILNIYSGRLAVHVRRGDYLLAQHSMHGLVEIKYIIAEIRRALQNDSFEGITLFSDSPELLDISEFNLLSEDVVIDQGGEATEVLNRMASHGGIIASNSSFSLWAGLLGRPRYFSLPQFWMPNIESSRLGLDWVRRYPCIL